MDERARELQAIRANLLDHLVASDILVKEILDKIEEPYSESGRPLDGEDKKLYDYYLNLGCDLDKVIVAEGDALGFPTSENLPF